MSNRYPFHNLQINKPDPKPYFEKKGKKSQRAPLLSNFKTKCINSDISTSLVSFGVNWVSKEAKTFKELEFLGLGRCFSAKIEQTLKNRPKTAVFG